MRTFKVAQRLHSSMLTRIRIDVSDIPSKYSTSDHSSNGVRSEIISNNIRSRARHTQDMIAVNEYGIYEALFASRRLEARKFREWTWEVMQKLRKRVGLEGYEVMRMTEPEIQEEIDDILDTLFYDEETGQLMQSVTVQGGDVEQIPFEI